MPSLIDTLPVVVSPVNDDLTRAASICPACESGNHDLATTYHESNLFKCVNSPLTAPAIPGIIR